MKFISILVMIFQCFLGWTHMLILHIFHCCGSISMKGTSYFKTKLNPFHCSPQIINKSTCWKEIYMKSRATEQHSKPPMYLRPVCICSTLRVGREVLLQFFLCMLTWAFINAFLTPMLSTPIPIISSSLQKSGVKIEIKLLLEFT